MIEFISKLLQCSQHGLLIHKLTQIKCKVKGSILVMGGYRTGTINARLDEAKTTYEVTFLTQKVINVIEKRKKAHMIQFMKISS